MKTPTRKYPFVIAGFVRRWERLSADMNAGSPQEWLDQNTHFSIWEKRDEWMLGPSEMQTASPFGFLLVWPLCLTCWLKIRPQTPGKPGSEIVIFWRIALWRWDVAGTKGEHWIGPFSWSGPQLHYD